MSSAEEALLTTSELIRFVVGSEIYFRESLAQCRAALGSGLARFLDRFTFTLVKPDGIMARRIGPLVAALRANAFEVRHADTLRFNRWSMRELWRYEMNLASLQRMQAIDVLLPATDSVLLLLEDVGGERGTDASARLSSIKGPAERELRGPHDLRTLIGAGTGLLNHIHVPDEPIDVVRELGVLLAPERRAALLAAVPRPQPVDVAALERRAYAQCPPHDLELAPVLARIAAACARRPDAPDARLVAHTCALAATEPHVDWHAAMLAANAWGLDVSVWDWIVLAAHRSNCNVPGVPRFIPALQAIVAGGSGAARASGDQDRERNGENAPGPFVQE